MRLPDLFFTRHIEVAVSLQADPFDLLKVWQSESGLNPAAHNPHGDASGIFQAMPSTLRYLGWSKGDAAFRKLDAVAQLDWAERYYRPAAGRLPNAAAVYVWNFLPADLDLAADPENVLVSKRHGAERRGSLFEVNAAFDANHDLQITVRELGDAIARNAHGPAWQDASDRLRQALGLQPVVLSDDTPFQMSISTTGPWSVHDLQFALDTVSKIKLWPDVGPGTIDGVMGPRTRGAIRAFQTHAHLRVDGLAGPMTRAALVGTLDGTRPG